MTVVAAISVPETPGAVASDNRGSSVGTAGHKVIELDPL